MKKILFLLGVVSLFLYSCDSYLESDNFNQTESENALKSVSDIKAARNGIYYKLGTYRFCGNNVIAIGDFAADMSVADGSSGHYVSINNYTIDDTENEFEQVWEYGYDMVSMSTQILISSEELLAKGSLTDSETNEIMLYRAEAYGLRALAYFHLVNIFGLPYGTDATSTGGLVLMENEVILPGEKVSRSSVSATYSLINSDIDNAMAAFEETTLKTNGFYLNVGGINALKARVSLYEGELTAAIAHAEAALAAKGIGEEFVVTEEAYLGMWSSLTISDEEIFTIAKTEDDNLSANSLNTLYGSYGGKVTESLYNEFTETDYRRKLINSSDLHPKKFDGIESSAATSNIPLFRVSEMKLIIAEASLATNIAKAKEALLFTASRDSEIETVDDLPSTEAELRAMIALERKKELFQEGHRWYDARRTGELISVANGQYVDFDVQKFVFPIPADEINSGFGCEQNEGWYNNLPE